MDSEVELVEEEVGVEGDTETGEGGTAAGAERGWTERGPDFEIFKLRNVLCLVVNSLFN